MDDIVPLTPHPFAGISQKLNRSHENIINFQNEVASYFRESPYPVFSNDNKNIIREALEYHQGRPVPLRFSVLAGEIIHHLRSCLDHIVWIFSDPIFRENKFHSLGFPILKKEPAPADMPDKFERKVQGIQNADVIRMILLLQPYNDPADRRRLLLLALHDMDIRDKHRELNIVVNTPAFQVPIDVINRKIAHESGLLSDETFDLESEFKRDGKLVPQIAFSDFLGRKEEIVEQAIAEMHNNVVAIVRDFSQFVPGRCDVVD